MNGVPFDETCAEYKNYILSLNYPRETGAEKDEGHYLDAKSGVCSFAAVKFIT